MRRLLAVLLLALAAVPAQAQSRAVVKWHASHPLWMLRGDIVTAAGVVTPGSGGGGVGLGGTNVWTGSNTFTDSLFTLADNGDATKKLQFELSGETTGNTLSLAFAGTTAAPVFNFTGGTIAVADGAQGTPSLKGTTATTTGIYFDNTTSGRILFTTNGGVRALFRVPAAGSAAFSLGLDAVGFSGGIGGADDVFLIRGGAAAVLQLGQNVNGAAVTQTIKAHNGITGSNIASPRFNLGSQIGTGTGNPGGTFIQRPNVVASGTGAQSTSDANGVCGTKTLSNTTATPTTIATIGLASNSGGAVFLKVSVRCDDGTNFDSDIVTSYVAYVNKAGTITVGTAVTTASAAANNSGSCTVAPTFTAGASLINVIVTPVIGTITPTTTTASFNIENFGVGAVICQ